MSINEYITPLVAKQAVDPIPDSLYIDWYTIPARSQERHLDIKKLEDRVDELISTVERLRSENKTLRDSQTSLITERDRLISKTEQARHRVNAMIERLRAMENE